MGHASYIVRPHSVFSARKSSEGEIRKNLDASEIMDLKGILEKFGTFYCGVPTMALKNRDGKVDYMYAARAVNVSLAINEMILKNTMNGGD